MKNDNAVMKTAADNQWVINQALKKANVPQQTLMCVEVVKQANEDGFDQSRKRPMTAKQGQAVTVK